MVQLAPPVSFVTESPTVWSRMTSRSFVPLMTESLDDIAFTASLRGRLVDGVFLSRVVATPHEVRRTANLIAASPRRCYKLMLMVRGEAELHQDERTATMPPGSLSIYDTTRPYEMRFPRACDAIVVMLPYESVEPGPHLMRSLTAITLAGTDPLTRLVTPFLVELSTDFGALEGATASRVVRTCVDLISTMLSQAALDRGLDHRHAEIMRRIRGHILDNLQDPNLGPESIAKAMFVSTRHLHELFREHGTTVAGWIREQRIAAIRDQLADPLLADRPIGEIATAHGYPDASHFSRAFRVAVGVSPRQFRQDALSAQRSVTG